MSKGMITMKGHSKVDFIVVNIFSYQSPHSFPSSCGSRCNLDVIVMLQLLKISMSHYMCVVTHSSSVLLDNFSMIVKILISYFFGYYLMLFGCHLRS